VSGWLNLFVCSIFAVIFSIIVFFGSFSQVDAASVPDMNDSSGYSDYFLFTILLQLSRDFDDNAFDSC